MTQYCYWMTNHIVYLSLGANLGNREQTVNKAIDEIGEYVGEVIRRSSLHITEPWGFASKNKFVNAVVCCRTKQTPREVLEQTQMIERKLGRTAKTANGEYHDRMIDIDILLYDDWEVKEPDLIIPHPLMYDREFVMRPLAEIRE